MKLPINIPCPTRVGTFADKDVRDALDQVLHSSKTGQEGDILGIAQSWWHSPDYTARSSDIAYWIRDKDDKITRSPFRSLTDEIKARISPAVPILLENTQARDEIHPQIIDMGAHFDLKEGWIDALHVKDGVLLLSGYLSEEAIVDAAKRGKLPSLVRFLSYPTSSQHERAAAADRMARLLLDISSMIRGSAVGDADQRLVPTGI